MRVGIFGNCQTASFAEVFRNEWPHAEISAVVGGSDTSALLSCDKLLIQSEYEGFLEDGCPLASLRGVAVKIPTFYFSGFHPDVIIEKREDGESLSSPAGSLNSAIVLYGYKNGLTHQEIKSLFRNEVYEALGYYDYWRWSVTSLKRNITDCGLNGAEVMNRIIRLGAFCHTVNHPTISAVSIIADEIAAHLGFNLEKQESLSDPLLQHGSWPIYPELAETHGLDGSYDFEFDELIENGKRKAIRLDDFIERSVSLYEQQRDMGIVGRRLLDDTRYTTLAKFAIREAPRRRHVYSDLPDTSYWKRSISNINAEHVDPVIGSRFKIKHSDKVATAGSCFAQHIARKLSGIGYNYFVAEPPPTTMSNEEAMRKGFGLFSARYGNIYTARQLRQLVERAKGDFVPVEQPWQRPDGRYVDPFRPQIEPEGFSSAAEVAAATESHLSMVRNLFANADYFVFTVGLTECWTSTLDGAVFPIAPGIVGGEMRTGRYAFVNFRAAQVVDDLKAAILGIRSLNKDIKFILTVSPVPLVATYENAHVLTATTYSKAALRSAVNDVVNDFEFVDYFPSFEIITGNYSRGEFFEQDLREVNSKGVERVMEIMQRHYFEEKGAELGDSSKNSFLAEFARSKAILCDEELLDASR